MAKRKMQDFDFSTKMRDVIRAIAADEIQKQRPRYRYATVNWVDVLLPGDLISVVFNGEDELNNVLVSRGAYTNVQIGDLVRVEGIGTDKFVTGIVRPATPQFSGINMVKLTGSGTYVPPKRLAFLKVRLVAGGGAGGSVGATSSTQRGCGAGGSGGAGVEAVIPDSLITSPISYSVGAGGTPVADSTGGTGGNTIFSFGSYTFTANGGPGGGRLRNTNLYDSTDRVNAASSNLGGYDQAISRRSEAGESGYFTAPANTGTPTIAYGGRGGGSFLALPTGREAVADGATAVAGDSTGADSWGAGGGGAASNYGQSAVLGGSGHAGIILLEEFLA